jgi:hypothetical protein
LLKGKNKIAISTNFRDLKKEKIILKKEEKKFL